MFLRGGGDNVYNFKGEGERGKHASDGCVGKFYLFSSDLAHKPAQQPRCSTQHKGTYKSIGNATNLSATLLYYKTCLSVLEPRGRKAFETDLHGVCRCSPLLPVLLAPSYRRMDDIA